MWKSYSSHVDMFSDSSSTESDASSNHCIPGFISVPMSDANSENSDPASIMSDSKAKMYQAYKGQVKLSVYVNYGLLTVHVIMGRHYKSKWTTMCDTYVKLSLLPDETRRTRCKTEIIHESNNPLYDEKFSFELLDEDRNKRLYISVWHRDNIRNQCEFLGCMSFGVSHIQKRQVAGWYYLLTGDVGRKKHLAVSEKKVGLSDRGGKNIPSVNQDVMWMEPHMLILKKPSKAGFGFSINGSCPVQVCKVEAGSPAEAVNLMKEDCIIRIDGLNVSRSTSESVARIIRHAKRQIVLEIQRPKRMSSVNSANKASTTLLETPKKPLCSSTPANLDPLKLEELVVSPWRPRRGSRMSLDMDNTENLPPRQAPPSAPPGENTGLFETHDYGWLDMKEKFIDGPMGVHNDSLTAPPVDSSSEHTYEPMGGHRNSMVSHHSSMVNQTDSQKETLIVSPWKPPRERMDSDHLDNEEDYVHPYPPGEYVQEHPAEDYYRDGYQGNNYQGDSYQGDGYQGDGYQRVSYYSQDYPDDYQSDYNPRAVDNLQFYRLTHDVADYCPPPPPPPSRQGSYRHTYQVDDRLHDIQEADSENDNSHIYEALDIAEINRVSSRQPQKANSTKSGSSSMKSGSSGYSSSALPRSLKLSGRSSSKYQDYGFVDGNQRDSRTGTGHYGWTGSLPRNKKVSFKDFR